MHTHTHTSTTPHSSLQLIEPCCYHAAAHMYRGEIRWPICWWETCVVICSRPALWCAPLCAPASPSRSTLLLPRSLGNVTYVYQTRSDAQARVTRKRSLSFPPWPAYDRAWETILRLIRLPGGIACWLLGCFATSFSPPLAWPVLFCVAFIICYVYTALSECSIPIGQKELGIIFL